MPTQTQQTDPSVTSNPSISYKPLKTAAIIGGKVLLSSDKTYPLTPESARHLAQQLLTSADMAEYSGQPKEPDNKTLQDEERKAQDNKHPGVHQTFNAAVQNVINIEPGASITIVMESKEGKS